MPPLDRVHGARGASELVGRGGERELHRELAAAAGALAGGGHGAAMQLDQLAHEVQADAEPTMDPTVRVAALHEDIEDPRKHVERDPSAIVAHADPEPLVLEVGF